MAMAANGLESSKRDSTSVIQLSLKVLKEFAPVGIPQEDIADLAELIAILLTTDDEDEQRAAVEGVNEIINQKPVALEQMDFKKKPGKELKRWTSFVSQKIKECREEAGLTQIELAEKSGLPQSHISRLEKGKHSPSHETLRKIADALGIEMKRLDPSS